MKKFILFAISFCFSVLLNAMVSKTKNISPTGLKTTPIATELSLVATNVTFKINLSQYKNSAIVLPQ